MPAKPSTDTKTYRTAKIAVRFSRARSGQVSALMAAQRWCSNQIVEALRLASAPNYPIAPERGDAVRHCYVRGKGADRARQRYAETGETLGGVPVVEWRQWDFDAWPTLKAAAELTPAPFGAKSKYGISAKQASAICQTVRGQIKGYFSHRKKGNYKAELPRQFKSAMKPSGLVWDVPGVEVKWDGRTLRLGTKTQIGGVVPVKVSGKFVGAEVKSARVSRDGAGQHWLHLSYAVEPTAKELPHSAAIDPGQIRSMVLADDRSRIRSTSGRGILAVKRQRERVQKGISRKRSRVFRAHVRQYLSDAERRTMAALESKTSGQGTRYARQRVAAARRAEQLERHVASGNTPESFRYRRYSRHDWELLQALKRSNAIADRKLKYANHCVARRVADWCEQNGVGHVHFGDVRSIPKGRKKGTPRRLQAKRNSLWAVGQQQKYLTEKLEEFGATLSLQSERYTSQACPNCGARRKPHARLYKCRACGWSGDRDGVGAANILSNALDLRTRILPGRLKPLSLAPVTKQTDARDVLVRDVPSRFVGQCNSLEDGDSSSRTSVREAGGVPLALTGESPRNARHAGKTAKSATKKVRARREDLATTPIAAVERSDDPIASTSQKDKRRRSAQTRPEDVMQLSLWE